MVLETNAGVQAYDKDREDKQWNQLRLDYNKFALLTLIAFLDDDISLFTKCQDSKAGGKMEPYLIS